MTADLSRFAMNQICTPKWTMPQAIEGCIAHGVKGLGIWRHFVDDYGVANTARHLRDAGMWAAALYTSHWLNTTDSAGFRSAIEANRRILDMAAAIKAPCLVMVVGGLPVGNKDISGQRERVRQALHELLAYAEEVGVRLGLEPLHPMYAADRSVLNSIRQVNDLCDELGDGSGLVADVYHCWWDPDFETELRRAGPRRLLSVHYSDWLVPTRTFRDRGMVGDGIIDLGRVKSWLDSIAYLGPFELEIFSELDWWERAPEDTVRIGIGRCTPYITPIPGPTIISLAGHTGEPT
jgi:sugar phosphate isomerase/epimerase